MPIGTTLCHRPRPWVVVAALLCASLSCVSSSRSAAQDSSHCPAGNLLRIGRVTASGHHGDLARLFDGKVATEGTPWNDKSAVRLENDRAHIDIEFDQAFALTAVVLQGDNNEQYTVEGSLDGTSYERLWTAGVDKTGHGLRTRHARLGSEAQAMFLRVQASGGDGSYSISELQVFCSWPAVWPPKLELPPPKTLWEQYGWPGLTNARMVVVKGVLAGLGTLLLLWGLWLKRRGEGSRYQRSRDVSLICLGILAFAAWWNWAHFHFDHYVHIWEQYHYYIGAKYAPELRYDRIYECTAAAEIADGLAKRVRERKMRDLRVTNEIGPTDHIIDDPTLCTQHFSDARWQAFRKDVRFFRARFSKKRWNESQHDHGYNATPVWAIGGRLLANAVPVTRDKERTVAIARLFDKDNVWALALVDSSLLVVMWGFVWWAFGWRAMVVALLWWGTNYPARFYWNGGAFLRYDWIVTLVIGLCFLKKEKMFAGGAALTYATLLRIFPGMFIAALVIKAITLMWRKRRFVLSVEHQRFAAGCIVALGILIPASSWATGGIDAWPQFAANSQKHLSTPLTNNMGLKTLTGFSFDSSARLLRDKKLDDPFRRWKDKRRELYQQRTWLYALAIGAFVLLLARATENEPDWVAAALGSGLIVMSTELTCYYFGFLLSYGLLWERRKLPGIAVLTLATITCALGDVGWYDERFTAISLATVLTVVLVTAHIAFPRGPFGPDVLLRPFRTWRTTPDDGAQPEPEEEKEPEREGERDEDTEDDKPRSTPTPEPA